VVDYYFRPQPAIDGNGDLLTSEGSGQIFAIDDTLFTTPLTVTLRPSGVTSTVVAVSSISQTAGFSIADHAEVYLKSGDFVSPLVAWSSIVEDSAAMLQEMKGFAESISSATAGAQSAVSQMTAQFLAFLGHNPNPNGVIVLAPLDPTPDPSLLDDGTLVVQLDPTEV
jgi:hypothetical protein